jgi:putative membrane protein
MLRISFAVVALLSGTAASAQLTGNPAGLSPDTPGIESASPATNAANTQDKLFVRQASLGNRAEVDLGKAAGSKASSAGVKAFAERMQKEHSKSLDELTRSGKAAKMELPKDLDAEHQRVQSELGKLSGGQFDQAYLTAQVADHQKTANLLLWHLSYGQNAELIRYSAETLPVVLEHLEHAKRELAALNRQPPGR